MALTRAKISMTFLMILMIINYFEMKKDLTLTMLQLPIRILINYIYFHIIVVLIFEIILEHIFTFDYND